MRILRQLAKDNRALNSTFAFVIAGAVLITISGAVFFQAEKVSREEGTNPEEILEDRLAAQTLLDSLLEQPGQTNQGRDWIQYNDAEHLIRLGILDSTESAYLDIDKIKHINEAPFEANATDGYANYEETAARYGVAKDYYGFRLEIRPEMQSWSEIREYHTPNTNIKPILIADYSRSNGPDTNNNPSIAAIREAAMINKVVNDFCAAKPGDASIGLNECRNNEEEIENGDIYPSHDTSVNSAKRLYYTHENIITNAAGQPIVQSTEYRVTVQDINTIIIGAGVDFNSPQIQALINHDPDGAGPKDSENYLLKWLQAGGNLIILGAQEGTQTFISTHIFPTTPSDLKEESKELKASVTPLVEYPNIINQDRFLETDPVWKYPPTDPNYEALNKYRIHPESNYIIYEAVGGTLQNGNLIITNANLGTLNQEPTTASNSMEIRDSAYSERTKNQHEIHELFAGLFENGYMQSNGKSNVENYADEAKTINLAVNGAQEENVKLLHNFMGASLSGAFAQYGENLPNSEKIQKIERLEQTFIEGIGPIDLKIRFYYFPTHEALSDAELITAAQPEEPEDAATYPSDHPIADLRDQEVCYENYKDGVYQPQGYECPEERDNDNDGVPNMWDNCPKTYNPAKDADGNTVNEPVYGNHTQDDLDNDARLGEQPDPRVDYWGGDACDVDLDNDGIHDKDRYLKGLDYANGGDNCPYVINYNQADNDLDGKYRIYTSDPYRGGDFCDVDDDNDGAWDWVIDPESRQDGDDSTDLYFSWEIDPTTKEGDLVQLQDYLEGLRYPDGAKIIDWDNCQFDANGPNLPDRWMHYDLRDIDQDGLGDACDEDIDDDGIKNNKDNCERHPNPEQKNNDRNQKGDHCDIDADGDGVNDKRMKMNVANSLDEHPDMGWHEGIYDNNDAWEYTIPGDDPCPLLNDRAAYDDKINYVEIGNSILWTQPEGHADNCGDQDQDKIINWADNCPFNKNTGQANTEKYWGERNRYGADANNQYGDACKPNNPQDFDGDGWNNDDDLCRYLPHAAGALQSSQSDFNNNDVGDVCEDWDMDIVPDGLNTDNCARRLTNAAKPAPGQTSIDWNLDSNIEYYEIFNSGQDDFDRDSQGDLCDRDIDGDGNDNNNDPCVFREDNYCSVVLGGSDTIKDYDPRGEVLTNPPKDDGLEKFGQSSAIDKNTMITGSAVHQDENDVWVQDLAIFRFESGQWIQEHIETITCASQNTWPVGKTMSVAVSGETVIIGSCGGDGVRIMQHFYHNWITMFTDNTKRMDSTVSAHVGIDESIAVAYKNGELVQWRKGYNQEWKVLTDQTTAQFKSTVVTGELDQLIVKEKFLATRAGNTLNVYSLATGEQTAYSADVQTKNLATSPHKVTPLTGGQRTITQFADMNVDDFGIYTLSRTGAVKAWAFNHPVGGADTTISPAGEVQINGNGIATAVAKEHEHLFVSFAATDALAKNYERDEQNAAYLPEIATKGVIHHARIVNTFTMDLGKNQDDPEYGRNLLTNIEINGQEGVKLWRLWYSDTSGGNEYLGQNLELSHGKLLVGAPGYVDNEKTDVGAVIMYDLEVNEDSIIAARNNQFSQDHRFK